MKKKPAPPPPESKETPPEETIAPPKAETVPNADEPATQSAEPVQMQRSKMWPSGPTDAVAQQLLRRDDTMAAAFTGVVPASLGEAWQLAQHLAKSRAVPSGLTQGGPETVLTVILAGMEMGLTPIKATQNLVNIKGNLASKADFQLAQVRRSGVCDYYTEGFERRGSTDAETRLHRKLELLRCPNFDQVASLIGELTADVPEGKPYGWAVTQRKGDPQVHLRCFTWLDAEQFIINERDDDGLNSQGQQRTQATPKKLSEKSNYRNSPQDMYPKRARVRVLAIAYSDVIAGLPAVEAFDGESYQPEITVMDERPMSTEDAIAVELGIVRKTNAKLADDIQAGFRQLDLGLARRLQLLRTHQANPEGVLDWLRTEYANRHNRSGRAKPDVLTTASAAAHASAEPSTEKPTPTEGELLPDEQEHAGQTPVRDVVAGLTTIPKPSRRGFTF